MKTVKVITEYSPPVTLRRLPEVSDFFETVWAAVCEEVRGLLGVTKGTGTVQVVSQID